MAEPTLNCRICGNADLHEFAAYRDLPRVTSDCKAFPAGGRLTACRACGAVQKPTDAAWQAEADRIYENYQPYFQSGGVEQAVFDAAAGRPRRRSTVILEKLAAAQGLGETGRVIDVGCGNGVLLKAFAEVRPAWQLNGHELSDLHKAELEAIPGFDSFYTGTLDDLPGGFDVITMMHALEHFPDPLAALTALRGRLSPQGALFVEVPNAADTPFDLLIADHVSHFTRHHLAAVAARAGLSVATVADDWVTKELSLVATPSGNRRRPARRPVRRGGDRPRAGPARMAAGGDSRRPRGGRRRTALRHLRQFGRRHVAVRHRRRRGGVLRRRGPQPQGRGLHGAPDPSTRRRSRTEASST